MKKFVVFMVTIMTVMALGPAKALAKEPATAHKNEIEAAMNCLEEEWLEYVYNETDYLIVSSKYDTLEDGVLWTVKAYDRETESYVEDSAILTFEEIKANSTYLKAENAVANF